ncbi:MAG: 2-C-methyl-D-erythritol 4-phosphate cytidylyltransferase [Chloroflexi bacterium]|nr:2-C-methyl-D-erythritol 4-phosphate cytidylyltransferase [Chloroflexota bacterium]
MDRVAAIVVGAGSAERMGTDKIFAMLAGKPCIAWPLGVLQGCRAINEIILVLHKDKMETGKKMVAERGLTKVSAICEGGRLRQDSVKKGLEKVQGCQWVLVHDGARPFLTGKLIDDGIEAARQTGAAVAAVPIKDTVKEIDGEGLVTRTLERGFLRVVQTPQVFRADVLKQAYLAINGEFTDDAAVVERAGYKVKLYPGDYGNIKITTPEDLSLAEIIARSR